MSRRAILIFGLLILSISLQAQPSNSISGMVTRAGSGEPIARARVVINADGATLLKTAQTVLTDSSGKYEFPSLAAGRYRVFVTHDGDIRGEYNANRRAGGRGTPIVLEENQSLKNIDVILAPTGSISGRVTNAAGDPVGFATVQALEFEYQQTGRVLSIIQTAKTNDLGEYRLFWLNPGQYVISVLPASVPTSVGNNIQLETGPGSPLNSGQNSVSSTLRIAETTAAALGLVSTSEIGETAITAYFPSVKDPALSTPIELGAGASIAGINLVTASVRVVRIRGQIAGVSPSFMRSVALQLAPRGGESASTMQRSASVSDAGTFEFNGVIPGDYDLLAAIGRPMVAVTFPGLANAFLSTRVSPGIPTLIPAPNDPPRRDARLPITISDRNMEDVQLTLVSGSSVSGHVLVQGLSPSESEALLKGAYIQLQPSPLYPPLAAAPAAVGLSGGFTLDGIVPGEFQVLVMGNLPQTAYIRSARYGDVDVLSSKLRFEASSPSALEIVLGTDAASIDVVVHDAKMAPSAGATVLLVPDAWGRQRTELFKTATTDAAGHVRFDRIVPGDYKLFAFEDLESGALWDPQFLRTYESKGKPLTIAGGSKANTDVQSIPVP